MKEYTVKIKSLTPILWTGDADRKNTTLRETGIIGSLRWWYEALIRGLGGSACDPTSDAKCPDKNGNRCDACELFGCTGWARKFRLGVESINLTVISKIKIGTRKK
ncbi:MAG TPA: type III-B CRISPR module RAMP protein Cmr1, partial [Deltaproteobacteria bacterium]|nr:type III-B CRISPR module RAMP protein Cmr1 [Deltaproteobacteria bacterium]